jgi:hypothetical protein
MGYGGLIAVAPYAADNDVFLIEVLPSKQNKENKKDVAPAFTLGSLVRNLAPGAKNVGRSAMKVPPSIWHVK